MGENGHTAQRQPVLGVDVRENIHAIGRAECCTPTGREDRRASGMRSSFARCLEAILGYHTPEHKFLGATLLDVKLRYRPN